MVYRHWPLNLGALSYSLLSPPSLSLENSKLSYRRSTFRKQAQATVTCDLGILALLLNPTRSVSWQVASFCQLDAEYEGQFETNMAQVPAGRINVISGFTNLSALPLECGVWGRRLKHSRTLGVVFMQCDYQHLESA
jgi:hypothetical protein